jgi:adenylate cyclase
VSAQLIEVASGKHLWAERYDRTLEDIFAVQDEVIATIVATLIGRLAASGAEQAQRKPPQLWAAYDHFLQGREHLQRFDAEAAAPLLRRAIELDPAYAPAYGNLAVTNYVLYCAHGRAEDLAEGLRAAQKAVALDPVDSCSHRALAMIYSLMRQYDLSGVHYDRAIALNPNDVDASTLRGLWLAYVGRGEEALRSMEADLRHNPFPPTWYWECRAIAYFQTRRYAEAIESYQRMDLLHWWTYCYIAACYSYRNEPELARRAAADVLRLKPDFTMQDLERAEYWRDPADLEHLKNGVLKAGLAQL